MYSLDKFSGSETLRGRSCNERHPCVYEAVTRVMIFAERGFLLLSLIVICPF